MEDKKINMYSVMKKIINMSEEEIMKLCEDLKKDNEEHEGEEEEPLNIWGYVDDDEYDDYDTSDEEDDEETETEEDEADVTESEEELFSDEEKFIERKRKIFNDEEC